MEWWNSRWLPSNPGIKQNNRREKKKDFRGEEKGGKWWRDPPLPKKGHSNAHHCYGRVCRPVTKQKIGRGKKTGIRKARNQRLTASFLIGSIFAVVVAIATLLQCDALAIRFALDLTIVWILRRRWKWTNGGTYRRPSHPIDRSKSNQVTKRIQLQIDLPSTTRNVNPSDST